MWRADALALIEKGCSEKAIEVEMRKSLASCSRGLWFHEKYLLGYSLLRILDEMKHSSPGEDGIQCDALLRAFYELSQWKGKPVRKYLMCLDSAANKVHIQFPGRLGDSDVAIEELMQDRFLKSIDSEIRMQIAHQIDRVPADKRPGYYGLVKFAVKKEKEIMAEKSQCKDSTHQATRSTSVFWKPNWPAQKPMPSVRMVAPAPEEDDYPPQAEQSG